MTAEHRAPVRVFGVGHPDRGDDGAGIWLARRLHDRLPGCEVREVHGDPMAMIAEWEGAKLVIVVDAMCSGSAPGVVRRFDATHRPVPTTFTTTGSSHGLGVVEAIELARALGRLPERLLVYGIEASAFAPGGPPSPPVLAGVSRVARAIEGVCRRQEFTAS